MTTKTCYACKESKELTEFYKSSKAKDGHRFECKVCSNAASKAYAKKNWSTKIQPKARGYRVKHRYGLTQDALNNLRNLQNGACAICSTPLISGGSGCVGESVDHCHISGAVRGLLCGSCNTGLGKFKDSVDILEAAIIYLRKHGTNLETNS